MIRSDRRLGCLAAVLLAACLLGHGPRAGDRAVLSDVALDGFVFREGSYVAGPYDLRITETDRSIEVVVAGMTLDRLPLADPAKSHDVEIVMPPPYERPEGIRALDGSGYPLYLQRLFRYETERLDRERALDVVVKHAERSDLVARIERVEDGVILVDATGDPYFVGEQPVLVPPPLSREETLELAERTLRAYQELLSQGGAILQFDDVDLFLPRDRVEDVLIPSLRILEERTASVESKQRRLSNRWQNGALARKLLESYRSSEELRLVLRTFETGGAR